MMKINFFLPLLALLACEPNMVEIENKIKVELKRQNDSIANLQKINSEAIESIQTQNKKEGNIQNTETTWNYSGAIDKYPIKAQINYGEGTNIEETGALKILITGYYFYESKKQKIPIEGISNGSGIVYFVAHTNGGDEIFEGQYNESMLENFTGTWSKGSKQLKFYLNVKNN